jgi:hypothetical protein
MPPSKTIAVTPNTSRPYRLNEVELWTYWLGYNLVRKVSAGAALEQGLHPRLISFTATKQALVESWQEMTLGTTGQRQALGQALLQALGKEEVGDRPGRCEPRAVKRRPKPHRLLMKPRQQARAELLRRGGSKGGRGTPKARQGGGGSGGGDTVVGRGERRPFARSGPRAQRWRTWRQGKRRNKRQSKRRRR